MKFDAEANDYSIVYDPSGSRLVWKNLGRDWVSDLADTGSFFSVPPGAYGIEFQYSDGKIADTKYGIVVN